MILSLTEHCDLFLDVFDSVMGRSLEERSVLHFQVAANREALTAQRHCAMSLHPT